MFAVTYLLELSEPVLARIIDGDPNSGVSATFLPGSMMRGVIAARIAPGESAADLAGDERRLLFDGSVRFLNAYPADEQGRRTLPAPVSWRRAKNEERVQYQCFDEAVLTMLGECTPDELEEVGGYVSADLASDDEGTLHVRRYLPRLQIALHTLRNRTAGRATRGDGSIFQIEALAAGQRFAGVIVTGERSQAERIKTLLTRASTFYLGGSATAGYGRTQLVQVDLAEGWTECSGAAPTLQPGESVVVTVLSDILLRGSDGAAHTNLAQALADVLPLTPVCAYKRTHPVGAFNRKWGLPTPQALALRAGSVFVLRATAPIAPAAWTALIENGIGERRVDGFGRIAVNWQEGEADSFFCRGGTVATGAPPATVDLGQAASTVRDMAQRMATRRRRQQLDAGLIEAILDRRLAIHPAPPNSQLSRVRVLVRSAMRGGSLASVADLFTEGAPTAFQPKAKKYFEKARITDGRQGLDRWLTDLARAPELVWRWLPALPGAATLGGVAPDAALAVEYAGRLIDGVLERAMKERNRAEMGGSDERAS
jgi:CRISPR-associated protein Csx10